MKRALLYVAVVVVLGASSAGMLARGQITFSSDQAVSALMALDIRDRGSHPVFYWGVQYAGTFEPHLLALVFRLVPSSVAAYRATMFLLLASGVLLVVAATELAFGRRTALLAGLYLSLGPSFLFYKGLTSDGAYVSVFAAMAAATALSVRLAEDRPPAATLGAVAGLGAALGLAWWIHPLSAVLVPVLAAAVLREPRRWLRPAPTLAFLAGLLAGGLPWWVRNFANGLSSLRASEMTLAAAGGLERQARLLVDIAIPVLLGGRSAWTPSPTYPGSAVVAAGLFVLALAAGAALLRKATGPARRYLLFASLAFIVIPPLQALVMARTDLSADPRYLLPAYIGVAAILGALLDGLIARGRRAVAAALVAVVLSLGVGSQLGAIRFAGDPQHGKLEESKDLVRELATTGPRELYSSYWDAYRLAFLSNEAVAFTPFGEGAFGPERSVRLKDRVDASPRPGFLLQPEPASRMEAFLLSRGVAFSRRSIAPLRLSLFTEIPPGTLAELRACGCIPAPGSPLNEPHASR